MILSVGVRLEKLDVQGELCYMLRTKIRENDDSFFRNSAQIWNASFKLNSLTFQRHTTLAQKPTLDAVGHPILKLQAHNWSKTSFAPNNSSHSSSKASHKIWECVCGNLCPAELKEHLWGWALMSKKRGPGSRSTLWFLVEVEALRWPIEFLHIKLIQPCLNAVAPDLFRSQHRQHWVFQLITSKNENKRDLFCVHPNFDSHKHTWSLF